MRFSLLPLLLLTSPAFAAAPTLEATLASPQDGRILTRGAAWLCGDTGCVTQSDASRPLVLCQLLAKEAGQVATFSVDGRTLDEDDLAKCNTKAR